MVEFNAQWLSEYLGHKLELPVPVDILDITRYGRGSSRETWFVTYRNEGEDIQVVFRLDFPAGSTDPSPLHQEFSIYDRLAGTGVPIARALWWEDDPHWTDGGRPFYVREHVIGTWEVPHFNDPDPRYDDLRISISREHMRKLALVHAVNWKSLGFDSFLPAPRDTAECAHVAIDTIMNRFEDIRAEGIPIMLEAAEWLHQHAPEAPRVSLCKGTNGLGEEIFRGDTIVAMSDWEEASIGDPAADFAFMQNFAPEIEREGKKLWGLQQALDYYAEVSGTRVPLENVRFYQVVRALKMGLFSHNAGIAVSRRPDSQIKQAWTGTEVMHIAKRNLAAAIGLMAPVESQIYAELNQTVEEFRR